MCAWFWRSWATSCWGGSSNPTTPASLCPASRASSDRCNPSFHFKLLPLPPLLLTEKCLFTADPPFVLCWSWSASNLIFIPCRRCSRVWITCTRDARLSTLTSSQKTSFWEWTRFTYRIWQPTPSCGSCRCPLLSPAPQVCDGDVIQLTDKQYSRCYNRMRVIFHHFSFVFLSFLLNVFACWCFHALISVNSSSRDKQVCSHFCILWL